MTHTLMEADIMEIQVRSVINIIFLFLLLSCDSDINIMVVNDSDINLDLSKRYVKYNNKIFSGKVVKLYSNTNDTFSISIYKNGLKDNIWKKFYRNGNIQELREYKKGKKIGKYFGYYINGNKKFEENFKNNFNHGKIFVWSNDGKLIRESNFINGYESGKQQRWDKNGKIISNYIIKNNRRYGLLGTKNCINETDSLYIY